MLIVVLCLLVGLAWLVLRVLAAASEAVQRDAELYQCKERIRSIQQQTIDEMLAAESRSDGFDTDEHWSIRGGS
jgi:hypothetical protein